MARHASNFDLSLLHILAVPSCPMTDSEQDLDALRKLAALDDDLNSEDLDDLEEEAENELMEEMKHDESNEISDSGALERSEDSTDESASSDYVFGPLEPENVALILSDLRAHGISECVRRHVLPNPKCIIDILLSLGVMLPRSMLQEAEDEPSLLLPILKMVFIRILRQRQKLVEYNTIEDAVDLIKRCGRIVVLCGAGISVSCGIPDFRSKDGIYAILARENRYELDDPSDMFDKETFLRDPNMFYSFAHSIYPANFEPSPSHRFVREIEKRNKLLRMYSQNIDTLEQKAGIERVIQCHGSFASATCTDPRCGYRMDGKEIRDDILAKRVPVCPKCEERREMRLSTTKRQKLAVRDDESEDDGFSTSFGIMKPDITFFGEKLPDAFEDCVLADRGKVDLILVMGTSLKVAPVADLLTHFSPNVPTILINRTPVSHIAMDIVLLGDSDPIVSYLCKRLGWPCDESVVPEIPTRVGDTHVWLFPGAEGGSYVENLTQERTAPDLN